MEARDSGLAGNIKDQLLLGCNLAALGFGLIGLWLLVAVLTATDTTNAISIGGGSGILLGAAGGYAQLGSVRGGWTPQVRNALRMIHRSIIWLTIIIAPLGLLADIVLKVTHCLGRTCSRDDQFMVWGGIVFTVIASVLTIASWSYLLSDRRVTRDGAI